MRCLEISLAKILFLLFISMPAYAGASDDAKPPFAKRMTDSPFVELYALSATAIFNRGLPTTLKAPTSCKQMP
jgi:hypothetical protein